MYQIQDFINFHSTKSPASVFSKQSPLSTSLAHFRHTHLVYHHRNQNADCNTKEQKKIILTLASFLVLVTTKTVTKVNHGIKTRKSRKIKHKNHGQNSYTNILHMEILGIDQGNTFHAHTSHKNVICIPLRHTLKERKISCTHLNFSHFRKWIWTIRRNKVRGNHALFDLFYESSVRRRLLQRRSGRRRRHHNTRRWKCIVSVGHRRRRLFSHVHNVQSIVHSLVIRISASRAQYHTAAAAAARSPDNIRRLVSIPVRRPDRRAIRWWRRRHAHRVRIVPFVTATTATAAAHHHSTAGFQIEILESTSSALTHRRTSATISTAVAATTAAIVLLVSLQAHD